MKNLTAYLFASILLSPVACMAMKKSESPKDTTSSENTSYDSGYYSWSTNTLADLTTLAKNLNNTWRGAAAIADSEKTELEKFGKAADAAFTNAGAAKAALSDAKKSLHEAQEVKPHMPESAGEKGCCQKCCAIQ